MTKCVQLTHDLMKASVELFNASSTGHCSWEGVYTGQCVECGSTIALRICLLCDAPCNIRDELPWGDPVDERVSHFECVARVMLSRTQGKFVILVGKRQAKEFSR